MDSDASQNTCGDAETHDSAFSAGGFSDSTNVWILTSLRLLDVRERDIWCLYGVARRSEVVADVGHIFRPNCSRPLTSMKCMGSKKGDRGKRAGMVLGARQVAINSECP